MTQTYPNATDLSSDNYIILGLATCFTQDDGELTEVETIEPVPSSAFEAILQGVPTSYKRLSAFALNTILPIETPDTLHKPDGFEDAEWGDQFIERFAAAARTYVRKPQATEKLAIGQSWNQMNYNLDRKRILNAKRRVKLTDNVKQHAHTHKTL
jgi:hypothetical protein